MGKTKFTDLVQYLHSENEDELAQMLNKCYYKEDANQLQSNTQAAPDLEPKKFNFVKKL